MIVEEMIPSSLIIQRTTTLVLKDITETKIVNVDLKNIFNDPDKIKFVIEK